MQWDLVRLLAKQAAWFLPERLWMKTRLFVTFLAMKKVRRNLCLRSRSFGISHREHHSKHRTTYKPHSKSEIKTGPLKHPQGNKLKWRTSEPSVWGGTTSWGERPECSVVFRGRFFGPRPFCYFLGQCQKVREKFYWYFLIHTISILNLSFSNL